MQNNEYYYEFYEIAIIKQHEGLRPHGARWEELTRYRVEDFIVRPVWPIFQLHHFNFVYYLIFLDV